MKYKLGIRKIEESDIGVSCPFMPEPDDFEIHLAAFVDEVGSCELVDQAVEEEGDIVIFLSENSDSEQLRRALLPINQCFWDKLRTTGLSKIA